VKESSMKVTSIKQQLNRANRYAIFLEGEYAFSLSGTALLDSKLTLGQEVTDQQIEELKARAAADALYDQTLRYLALRQRTAWEIKTYLTRKGASPPLADNILNKLSNVGLVDDAKFTEAYINDHQLLRPTSRRKLILELRKKHVTDEVIQRVMRGDEEHEPNDEQTALQAIIARKRKQPRYQDDLKLMQYLARQGFNYSDIKSALQNST